MFSFRRQDLRAALLCSAGIAANFVLDACASAITPPTLKVAASVPRAPSTSQRAFKFRTVVDRASRTFNEALGINDGRTVAGYDGSGAAGQPSRGFTAVPGFSKNDFTSENYPGSAQTQVTAINGSGDTAGVWADAGGAIHGFVDWDGVFTSYNDPNAVGATEILGINDSGIAVGFYIGSSNLRYGFTLNQATGTFASVAPPYASDVTASGINDDGDIVGYYFSGDEEIGFLEKGGTFTSLYAPGALSTMATGVNAHDAIVGTYLDSNEKPHGFLLQDPLNDPQWTSVDAPQGAYGTYLNGINDRINMVGYYVDPSSNTIGVLVERKKM